MKLKQDQKNPLKQGLRFTTKLICLIMLVMYGIFASTNSLAQADTCVKANFSFAVDGNTVKFEGTGSGPITHWLWTFGDSTYGNGKDIKHQFARPGSYKVCLTVYGYDSTNKRKCTFTVCKEITIKPGNTDTCRLQGAFEIKAYDDKIISVHAKSNSNHAVYYWDFGDNETSTGIESKHQYKKPGVYEVCLTIYDTLKRCKFRTCKKVEIKDPCKLELTFDSKNIEDVFVFYAKSNAKDPVYTWYFGDGTKGEGKEVKHKYDKTGTYEVCLYLLDKATKCEAKICKKIVVERKCTLRIDFTFQNKDDIFGFQGKSNADSAKYYWDFGDGESDTGQNLRHTYAKPGVYEVCLTVVDLKTQCKERICKKIEVPRKCDLKADFTIRNVENKFGFKATSNSRDAKYYWTFGDGTSGEGQNIRHKYTESGVYEVCLTVVDRKTECKVTVCKKIRVEVPCDLNAKFRYQSRGNTAKFVATSNSRYTIYTWSFGDRTYGRGKTVAHKYDTAGIYEVCLTAYDTVTECKTTVCRKIAIGRNKTQKSLEPDKTIEISIKSSTAFENTVTPINSDWNVTIYPNPVRDQLVVNTTEPISKIQIFGLDGQLKIEETVNSSNATLNLSSLPMGYYLVKVYDQNQMAKVSKLFKN